MLVFVRYMYDKAKINATDRQTISYSYYWVNNFICFLKIWSLLMDCFHFIITYLHLHVYWRKVSFHSNMSILQRIPTKNIKSYALTSSQIKIENIIFLFGFDNIHSIILFTCCIYLFHFIILIIMNYFLQTNLRLLLFICLHIFV